MKIILHLAISADGFIAKSDGDSDWVSPVDDVLFKQRIQEAGCVVIGKTTFKQYEGVIYPVEGVVNIVLTSELDLTITNALSVTSPLAAIELAKEKGCSGVLIAGGARTSAAFLEANLIDEIFFSMHPLLLGQGMKPFEGISSRKDVTLLGSRNLEEGLVEFHYDVLR